MNPAVYTILCKKYVARGNTANHSKAFAKGFVKYLLTEWLYKDSTIPGKNKFQVCPFLKTYGMYL